MHVIYLYVYVMYLRVSVAAPHTARTSLRPDSNGAHKGNGHPGGAGSRCVDRVYHSGVCPARPEDVFYVGYKESSRRHARRDQSWRRLFVGYVDAHVTEH